MTLHFEPFSEAVRRDPYPHYRQLREQAPVFLAESANLWVVSRHADVRGVLTHPELFSSDAMGSALLGDPAQPAPLGETRMLILSDPPDHGRLRNIVNRGFTPRRIADLEPRLREIVDGCMARVRERPDFDLVADLSVPVPVAMIAELLGVESDRLDDFKLWSDAIIASSTGSGRGLSDPVFLGHIASMRAYLDELVERRRAEPREDLISTVALSSGGEEALSAEEMGLFALLLLVAGNETTTNLIGNAVRALLDHPEQLERVCADPRLVDGLIEETLRYDSPIQYLFRRTRRPVEIAGVALPENAAVLALLGSANRDERVFAEPDRFDVTRNTRGHLAFGFGIHFCLGAALARLEARVALEALVPELPHLRRRDREFVPVDSFVVRGPRELPLQRVA